MKKYYKYIRNILISIVIILLFLWIAAPSIPCDNTKKATIDTMCLKMYAIEKRILKYKKDYKKYPSTENGLSSLLQNNLNGKPYLKKIPKDVWRIPFKYIKLDNYIELISYGYDRKENTEDDIYLSKCKERI